MIASINAQRYRRMYRGTDEWTDEIMMPVADHAV